MKKDMPLEGLRWSRDSGSALYDTPQTAVLGRAGGVNIGKYCHIAKGLTIYSHNHNYRSDNFIPYDDEVVLKPVIIGDCVWIGCNVTIAPGTQIGKGCVVSSGSVVFGTIPDYAIIRGNPAVVIGSRNVETFDKLYNEEKFK